VQKEIEKVRTRREEYAAMKEQMEEEKAVIDRERAIAEGRDGEAKEEEVDHPLVPVEACPNTASPCMDSSSWHPALELLALHA